MSSVLKVAVLDDYLSVSKAHFNKLDPNKYIVEYFPNTLNPYNHPSTLDLTREEIVNRLEPFDIICGMRERTPFPRELLERLPNLKLLLNTGPRNQTLDTEYCKHRGIPVAGTKDIGHVPGTPDSTTQHCVAMILALARGLVEDDANLKTAGTTGKWQIGLATGLSGKTLGCVGLGRLGCAVAKIMNVAFGMKIVAWSENLTQKKADDRAVGVGLLPVQGDGERTFKVVGKEELFRLADVVSVHVVLGDRSRGLITKKELEVMKESSFLVNTSRGPVVVERDLLDVLKMGRIRGVGLDVFDLEPLPLDSEWRNTKWGVDNRSRVLLTPHMAYMEENSVNGYYEEQVENILRWERGEELMTPLL